MFVYCHNDMISSALRGLPQIPETYSQVCVVPGNRGRGEFKGLEYSISDCACFEGKGSLTKEEAYLCVLGRGMYVCLPHTCLSRVGSVRRVKKKKTGSSPKDVS